MDDSYENLTQVVSNGQFGGVNLPHSRSSYNKQWIILTGLSMLLLDEQL
jgi:hypothetical protein